MVWLFTTGQPNNAELWHISIFKIPLLHKICVSFFQPYPVSSAGPVNIRWLFNVSGVILFSFYFRNDHLSFRRGQNQDCLVQGGGIVMSVQKIQSGLQRILRVSTMIVFGPFDLIFIFMNNCHM